jgi:hypothetical protein
MLERNSAMVKFNGIIFAALAISILASPYGFVCSGALADDVLPSMDELNLKLKSAQNIQMVSSEPQILYSQMDKIGSDIDNFQEALHQKNDYQDTLDQLQIFETKLNSFFSRLTTTSCDSAPDVNELLNNIREVSTASSSIGYAASSNAIQGAMSSFFSDISELRYPHRDLSDCGRLKSSFGTKELQQPALASLASLKALYKNANEDYLARAKVAQQIIDVLQQQQDKITTALKGAQTKEQLSQNLWLLILILGGLGIVLIFVVRLFNDRIQLEWVISGQVTQFVTVMILLSVIFGLGLSDILKENTLGTLLGGIAGYVLSQGVGRAAAREVGRQRTGAQNLTPDAAHPAGQQQNPAGQ